MRFIILVAFRTVKNRKEPPLVAVLRLIANLARKIKG